MPLSSYRMLTMVMYLNIMKLMFVDFAWIISHASFAKLYIVKIIVIHMLTFNIQQHCVTFTVTLIINTNACVRSTARSCHILQNQTLICYNYSSQNIVIQWLALEVNQKWRATCEKCLQKTTVLFNLMINFWRKEHTQKMEQNSNPLTLWFQLTL